MVIEGGLPGARHARCFVLPIPTLTPGLGLGMGLGFAGVGWGWDLGCGSEVEFELELELESELKLELELELELALGSNNPTRHFRACVSRSPCLQACRSETSAYPRLKGPQKFVNCETRSQLKGTLNLWIVWCGYGVRQSREGFENGHGEGAQKDSRCAHGALTLPPWGFLYLLAVGGCWDSPGA